ncbi:MAG: hydrogenase maturation nickel metallochaperone HypA [Armatimonadia bacterium]|nr:hydrogenase maturation nickel metallochaperone HypA [Armatimonadia bacterium]
MIARTGVAVPRAGTSMHDVTAAQRIAGTVLQAAQEQDAERVERVQIALGAMTMIDPEQLEFWLEQVFRGTVAEGAQVQIEQLPLRVRCEACDHEGEVEVPDDPIYHLMPYVPECPACGSDRLEVLGGDACVVRGMRVTDAEASDDA